MKKSICILLSLAMILCTVSVFAAEETVKVTFDENNGSEPYVIEVQKGEILHEMPYAEGDEDHVSTGWYYDKEATESFDITVPITEDITVFAGWHAPMDFSDISEGDEFFDDIKFVFYTDIMYGVSDTEFAPKGSLTRAMLVAILYRYEGEPAFMNDLVFTDVEKDSYYEKAVVWANGKGIVYGVSDTEFAPYENITREQLAAILFRYAQYKEIPIEKASEDTNTLSFDDIADISEYAVPAVHCCLATDVLAPRGTKIEPKEDATRAESAHAIRNIGCIFADDTPSYSYVLPEGSYQDTVSQRAGLLATPAGDGVDITVLWGDSASQAAEWTMHASFAEDGSLVYNDCTKKILTMTEEGKETEEVEYENGEGSFTVSDDKILWTGAEEENCKECVFEKLPDEDPFISGTPNPMVAMTEEEFKSELGIELNVPEGAEDVEYYIVNGDFGEVQFTLDGQAYTARVKASAEFEDISGMYFGWTSTEDCEISGRSGKVMRNNGEEETPVADACLWFDAAPGIMYSVTATGEDLSDVDITEVAEKVFIPMQ